MVGMFAAQAWQSGSSIGLLVYIGGLALLGLGYLFKSRMVSGERRLPED